MTQPHYQPSRTGTSLGATAVALAYDGTTDNYATIMTAANALPYGGIVRLPASSAGNKVAVSSDLILPAGVILACDERSTKLASDEAVGPVIVPTAGYASTVIATDVVGGTLASAANSTYTLTRSSGSWAAGFVPGLIVTLVGAAGGAAVPTNCQIISVSAGVMTLTGGCTGGTCTGLTAVWGALVVPSGNRAGLRHISADAGTTVPRAICSVGFRNELDHIDAHGGTLAALDLPNNGLATTNQPILINANTENNANGGTVYARQYGPYSARFAQGDMQLIGGRFINGTKAFSRGCSAAQIIGPHYTGATRTGPNVELGAIVNMTNIALDSADGRGTCLVQHLTGTENLGFNAGNSQIDGCLVFPDATVSVPLLLEDGTISSVRFRDVAIIPTGNTISLLAQGANADTSFRGVEIGNGAFASTSPFTLWSGGVPGAALDINYNNGTTTVSLDGNGATVPSGSTTAITAGADNAVATTATLYEGTYRVALRALMSGSTSAGVCDIYVTAGTATISGNAAGTSLSNATAGNVWNVSADGYFTVTAAGTVNLNVRPVSGMTGTIVANKTSSNQGKAGATAIVLTKVA